MSNTLSTFWQLSRSWVDDPYSTNLHAPDNNLMKQSTDEESDSTPDAPVFSPILATLKVLLFGGALFLLFVGFNVAASCSPAGNTAKKTRMPARKELTIPREIPPPNIQPRPQRTSRLSPTTQRQPSDEAPPLRADPIWAKPRPSLLETGLSLDDVNYLLAGQPKVVYEDTNNKSRYSWRISPTETIFGTFTDDVLSWWSIEVIDKTEPPEPEPKPQRPAEVENPFYPMAARAAIRGELLNFHLYDRFNYTNAYFVITSGGEMYWYQLEFLPGAKTSYVKLGEFSQEGYRFNPYGRIVDTLSVVAVRPDGYRGLFQIIFTGNTRK